MVAMVRNGVEAPRAETADFWAVVFNPSTIERLTHALIGDFVLGSFFIIISGLVPLEGQDEDFASAHFPGR